MQSMFEVESNEEVLEYDDSDIDDDDFETDNDSVQVMEVEAETNFLLGLLGGCSRYGRAV